MINYGGRQMLRSLEIEILHNGGTSHSPKITRFLQKRH